MNEGMSMQSFRYETYRGAEIVKVADSLYYLAITVFREFPYLYEPETEENHLERYTKMENSFALMIYDGDKLAGATTASLLKEEVDMVRTPYEKAGFDPDKTFYFGESMLLPEYRGMGNYKKIMSERIKAAVESGADKASFISVIRPDNHPLKPTEYMQLKPIWNRYGFFENPHVDMKWTWKDVDKPKADLKSLTAWVKDLT
jgi:GNAT superfamily N-acetyltransferase